MSNLSIHFIREWKNSCFIWYNYTSVSVYIVSVSWEISVRLIPSISIHFLVSRQLTYVGRAQDRIRIKVERVKYIFAYFCDKYSPLNLSSFRLHVLWFYEGNNFTFALQGTTFLHTFSYSHVNESVSITCYYIFCACKGTKNIFRGDVTYIY